MFSMWDVSFLLGLFYGILLIMIGYNFFVYLVLRERNHLFYVLFIASFLLYYLAVDGWLVYPAPLPARFYGGLIALLAMLFNYTFLEIPQRLPQLGRFFKLGFIGWGIALPLFLLLPLTWLTNFILVLALLSILLVLGAAFKIWWQGYLSVRYFILAWSIPAISGMLTVMAKLGWLPDTLLIEQVLRLGVIFLVLFLSLALADRINSLQLAAQQANRRLQESESRLEQFLNAVPLGVMAWDKQAKVSYLNRQVAKIIAPLGFSPDPDKSLEEALTQRTFYVAGSDQLYPHEKLPVVQAMAGQAAHADDIELARGEQRLPLEIWASPIYDEQGQVSYALLIIQDISQRKAAEVELEQYRLNLEALVRERTAELNRSIDYLEYEITERRQAETKIQEQNQFLQSVIEAIPSPFYVIDATTYELKMANSASLTLASADLTTCYALTQRQTVPCGGPDHPCPLPKIKSSKAPVTVEHRHTNPDGEPVYLEIHAYPIFDKNGQVVQMVEYSLDITHRKQTEAALQQRNRQLALINRAGQVFGSTLELERVLEIVLTEIHQLLKIDGTSFWLLIPEKEELVCRQATVPEKDKLIGQRLKVGQGFVGQAAQNGQAVIVQDTRIDPAYYGLIDQNVGLPVRAMLAIPLQAKDRVIGVISLVDRTAGRFHREDLALLEPIATTAANAVRNAQLFNDVEQQRLVARSLHEIGVILNSSLDLQTVLTKILEQLRRVIAHDGASLWLPEGEELVLTAVDKLDPKIIGLRMAMAAQVFNRRQPLIIPNAQIEPYRSAWIGDKRLHTWMGAPLLIGERVIGVLTVGNFAVGAYTEAEARILQVFADQAAIAIENARLFDEAQKARDSAEAANQTKNVFLATMSHELRTPLNGILGYTQILKRSPNMDDGKLNGLEIIEQSGQHLLTLINDILDFSKIEAGRIKLQPAEIRFARFLAGIVRCMQMHAFQQDLAFGYEVDDNLPEVIIGDEKRLRQVLINLLGNAVKFTRKGQVTLRVRLVQEGAEPVQAGPEGAYRSIRFEVEDTGIGIPVEQLDKIFEPFEQADPGQQQSGGTGLGLPISQQLAQLMGGEIEVRSQVGQGSLFWVELSFPIIETASRPLSPDLRQIVGIDGQAPQVLVVDDNPHNLMVLVNLLAPVGFQIIEATNGLEAFARADEDQPQVIITDLRMPGMDGFTLIRKVRQSARLNQTVLIAVSANVYQEDHRHSLAMGADAFLSKPIESDVLFAVLQEQLGLKWLYEAEETEIDRPLQAVTELSPPPPDQLEKLLELALIGDIRAIQQQAMDMSVEEQFQPFAAELIRLAKTFQLDQIREMLKSYSTRG